MKRLLWISLGLFAFAMFGFPSTSTADEEQPADRPSPRRAAPPSKVLTVPTKEYKIFKVKMMLKLRDRKSIRTRNTQFAAALDRTRTKIIKMKHGLVSLKLFVTLKDKKIKIVGDFRASGQTYNIKKVSRQLNAEKPKWDMTIVHESKKKDASLEIQIDAEIATYQEKSKDNNFTFNVKGVSLHRLLSRLAEFNNLKLSFSPDVKNVKPITLKLKAPTRMGLIKHVCNKYEVSCKKEGTFLLVRKKAKAAPTQ
ncbi:MAG: hypothetical protein EP343_33335 [Deltaproteobacteria bacterium]|nr:MAG: hypothetical protein EP343_33335 [Deltaproteobacteria bacterium]